MKGSVRGISTAWREPPTHGFRRTTPPLVAVALALSIVAASTASASTTWSRNLYNASAFLYQDPYSTACVPSSTMIMLNLISLAGTGGRGFAWRTYRTKNNTTNLADQRDMVSIFGWERAHDTLPTTARGTDPHGWRNGLDWYGWGSYQDRSKRVYEDLRFGTFDNAVKAAVRSIARFRMPVGILAWAGRHAQVMHGYTVVGADPRVSDNFTVVSVVLSDPLYSDQLVNKRITLASLRTGSLKYRFRRYTETDSRYDDPYTPGILASSISPLKGPSEWYGRWLIVAPVRAGLPAPSPTPTPKPTAGATPTPTPTAGATPTPTPATTPEPTATPTPAPTATPTPAPTATPTEAPAAEAKPTPSATPTPPSVASAPAE
jgi:hypothetical protein